MYHKFNESVLERNVYTGISRSHSGKLESIAKWSSSCVAKFKRIRVEDGRPRGATMGDNVGILGKQNEFENISYQSVWIIPSTYTHRGVGGADIIF